MFPCSHHRQVTAASDLRNDDDAASKAGKRASLDAAGLPRVIAVALDTHGTRAVQKLVETLRSPEQVRRSLKKM